LPEVSLRLLSYSTPTGLISRKDSLINQHYASRTILRQPKRRRATGRSTAYNKDISFTHDKSSLLFKSPSAPLHTTAKRFTCSGTGDHLRKSAYDNIDKQKYFSQFRHS
jgi:hypothetical protein